MPWSPVLRSPAGESYTTRTDLPSSSKGDPLGPVLTLSERHVEFTSQVAFVQDGLSIVDENDLPTLSAKHLRGGQASWPTPDNRYIEM